MRTTTKPGKTERGDYVCPYHRKNPEKPYAGCTCSIAYTREELK